MNIDNLLRDNAHAQHLWNTDTVILPDGLIVMHKAGQHVPDSWKAVDLFGVFLISSHERRTTVVVSPGKQIDREQLHGFPGREVVTITTVLGGWAAIQADVEARNQESLF